MRSDRERLLDILEAIERYTGQGRERFDADELVRVWCLRHLEVVGEAVAKLPEELRVAYPAVPWVQIVGMRNILIHAYFSVNWERVWNVVAYDLPSFKATLRAILEERTE